MPLEFSIGSLKGDLCLHLKESVESRIGGHSGDTHPRRAEVSHADPVPTTGAQCSSSGMRAEES